MLELQACTAILSAILYSYLNFFEGEERDRQGQGKRGPEISEKKQSEWGRCNFVSEHFFSMYETLVQSQYHARERKKEIDNPPN